MSELVVRSTNVPASFAEQMEMARVFAASSLLPVHLRGKPENILVILDGARALDVPSFWAFQSMYVVDGKLTLSAELMRALVRRAGHKFRVKESTGKKAVVSIVRSDDPEFEFISEFTMDDAKIAELSGKSNWKKYPKAMLLARATAQAVRGHCDDVLFGVVYTPEELGAAINDDGTPVVDNNGKIVIESTSNEGPVVDQEMVDRCADVLTSGVIVDAANAVVMAQRLKVADKPASGGTDSLQEIWHTRLRDELTVERLSQDELREYWRYANGTNALDAPYNDKASIGDQIMMLREKETARAEEAALAEQIQTENAERLRAEAAASWTDDEDTSVEETAQE